MYFAHTQGGFRSDKGVLLIPKAVIFVEDSKKKNTKKINQSQNKINQLQNKDRTVQPVRTSIPEVVAVD